MKKNLRMKSKTGPKLSSKEEKNGSKRRYRK